LNSPERFAKSQQSTTKYLQRPQQQVPYDSQAVERDASFQNHHYPICHLHLPHLGALQETQATATFLVRRPRPNNRKSKIFPSRISKAQRISLPHHTRNVHSTKRGRHRQRSSRRVASHTCSVHSISLHAYVARILIIFIQQTREETVSSRTRRRWRQWRERQPCGYQRR